MITIVDYGMGNLGSVANMFKRVGVQTQITGDLNVISKANKILLPGVGAFDAAMSRIDNGGFREVLDIKANIDRVPILGICLGMQLLTRGSEEGNRRGLNWIRAETTKFSFELESNLKVPHMGWNKTIKINPSLLTNNMPGDTRFYFVHSYYVKADREEDVIMRAHFGHYFDAVISNGENIFGAQFHPEKSHKFGMQLFENFAKI